MSAVARLYCEADIRSRTSPCSIPPKASGRCLFPGNEAPRTNRLLDASKVFSDGVSSTLYAANRDFAYVDSQALCEAKVADGVLTHGDLRWRVLVLPDADTLPMKAWENVAAFWRQGGVVIAVGTRPLNSEVEFPSPHVQAIARELFGTAGAPCVVANPTGGCGYSVADWHDCSCAEDRRLAV